MFQSFAACASWVRVVFSGAVTVGLLLEQTDRRTMLTPLWYPQQRATSFFGQLAELVQRAFGRVGRVSRHIITVLSEAYYCVTNSHSEAIKPS